MCSTSRRVPWNAELADDPRIAVRYDFERRGRVLWDSTADRAHGTIVGCEWTNGRWAEKKALEFKRPSDRVRVDIPGSFDALTLTAWIRVDAITNRAQALLLTDGYEVGRPHWQISPQGALRLGIRLPAQTERIVSSGYGSPVLFTPRQIGVWSLVATVYDRAEGVVRHFVDGREVAKEALQQDRSLQIGAAEIGNWGAPLGGRNQPIRNFIGRMHEMTLWRVALSAEEMQAIYQRTRP